MIRESCPSPRRRFAAVAAIVTLFAVAHGFPDVAWGQLPDATPVVPLNTTAWTDHWPVVDNMWQDAWPSLATDGSGLWVAVWMSLGDAGGTNTGPYGVDADIFYSQAEAPDFVWSDPLPINPAAATDSADDLYPTMVEAGGTFVTIWQRENGTTIDILVSRGTLVGGVLTWAAPSLLDTFSDFSPGWDHPLDSNYLTSVAGNGVGGWVAVWERLTQPPSGPSDTDIVYSVSTTDGVAWTPQLFIDPVLAADFEDDRRPHVEHDGLLPGTWIVVWESSRQGNSTDIFFSRNFGFGWSGGALLNPGFAGTGISELARVAADGSGNWLAVWRHFESSGPGQLVYSTSTNHGATWDYPVVHAEGAIAGARALADGHGQWVMIWAQDEPNFPRWIWADRSSYGSPWIWHGRQPVSLIDAQQTGFNYFPSLATDRAGGWAAVWHSNEQLAPDEFDPESIGSDQDVLFSTFTTCIDDDVDFFGANDSSDCYESAIDCNDTDPAIYPGAPEIIDGKDNQCPGDEGYLLIDELTAPITFGPPSQLCWPSQPQATSYDVVRSTAPTFESCTWFNVPDGSCLVDSDEPGAGETFFYLARAATPFAGSWGLGEDEVERTGICSG